MQVQSRYQNGKVYKLVNCVDDKIYIGSTCARLSKRFYDPAEATPSCAESMRAGISESWWPQPYLCQPYPSCVGPHIRL